MAWLESHQTLAGHPKTRKLAHLLGASKPAVIGHLHCLWWWALDYADDGDLSGYDALDIAIGAEWEGDPDQFVAALTKAGFLDHTGDSASIHDWEDYAGKLVKRKRANAKRMREAREAESSAREAEEQERAAHVQRTQRARVEPQDRTGPDRTGQDQTGPSCDGANAPSRPPAKRATQVPRDFRLSESLMEWGRKPDNGFTVEQMESQIPRFLDHWIAKGETRKDWDATFRTWMRNARDWGHIASPPSGPLTVHRGGKPSGIDVSQQSAAQVRREMGWGDDNDNDVIETTYRSAL